MRIVKDDDEIVSVNGNAKFSIAPGQGFQLESWAITGFSLFGMEATFDTPTPDPLPPSVKMVWPVDGDVVNMTALFEDERYIDVLYVDNSGSGLDASTILDEAAEFFAFWRWQNHFNQCCAGDGRGKHLPIFISRCGS
jgi:hypothetical protein